MGRRRGRDSRFEEWREGFRRRLMVEFDEAFAAEAMGVLDAEVEAFGTNLDRDLELLEVVVPGRVLAARRSAARG